MKLIRIYILFLLFLFLSCNVNDRFTDEEEYYSKHESSINPGIASPENIRLRAYESAAFYVKNKIPYVWGGDYYIEPNRTVGVDCSGLIINNYKYAVKGSEYSLPFADSTAHNMYLKYTNPVLSPEKGDLIFWKNKQDKIYHVAIFEKESGDYYYFIDSTEFEGVNGVTYRYINKSLVYTVKRLLLK